MTNAVALAPKATQLNDASLDLIFRDARTHSAWLPKPVSTLLLGELYDLLKMAPTAANGSPGRFVFLTTPQAKERILPAMAPGNVDKTRTAPVTAIVAMDTEFYEKLPRLFPHTDARSWFVGKQAAIDRTILRDSSLQGAYFIMAARALGLDCGPMSGFDADKINAEFFHDGKWKVNFVCNLGYGDKEKLHPRLPRLDFEDACVIM